MCISLDSPNEHWFEEERQRAKARLSSLPLHARPIVTNPKLSAHKIPTAHPINRKKKMDIKHGRKTSFDIDYVDVTEENIQEVADWCGGTVIGTGSGPYIQIEDKSAMNSRQTKAYVDDVMTKHLGLGTFRAFSRKAFEKAYHEIVPGDVQEDDRSSVTGQYVTHAEAVAHPDTTVHETNVRSSDGVDPKTLGQSDIPADAGLGEK